MLWIVIGLLLITTIYWLFMSPFSQIFGKFPYKAEVSDKLVALTFDDGPNEPYTSQILEYFGANNIYATFFIVGKNAQKHPEIVKKIYKNGHTVGNHSLSHQFYKYIISPTFKNEVSAAQVIMSKLIGKQPGLFRPPWLWRQPFLLNSLKKQKINPVSGEFCDILEVFQPSGAKIARRTIAKVKPGSIIIFHDGYNSKGADRTQTVQAVKIVVEELSKQNYRFVTVDNLLNVPPYI